MATIQDEPQAAYDADEREAFGDEPMVTRIHGGAPGDDRPADLTPEQEADVALARQATLVVRAFALCLNQLAGTEPLTLRVDIAIRLARIVVKG